MSAEALDRLGRVIDFGVIKGELGAWVDEHLDHGAILNAADAELVSFCRAQGWRVYTLDGNPTAENIARMLFEQAERIFGDRCGVVNVRVRETPNCWADYGPGALPAR